MKFPLWVILLLCAAPPQLCAAINDNSYLFQMSLDELVEVEITGSTLTPKSLKTVPASVTIFSHDDIARLGFDSLD